MTNKTLWWLMAGAAVLAIAGGGALSMTPDIVQKIANAIGIAERGQAEIVSGRVRNNNPGDIEDGHGHLIVYSTLEEGWTALYHQVSRILSGSSPYYPAGGAMTIAEVGYVYADGLHDPTGAVNWANNVAAVLGVSTDTPLNQV